MNLLKKILSKTLFILIFFSFLTACTKESVEDSDNNSTEVNERVKMTGVFHGFFNGVPQPQICCGGTEYYFKTSSYACDNQSLAKTVATYRSMEDCLNDMKYVYENSDYQTNYWAVGPNAIGSGNSGGGSGSGCDVANYNGPNPPNDINIYAICSAAYIYQCTGNESARIQTCNTYQQLAASWTGPGAFPTCPYCN